MSEINEYQATFDLIDVDSDGLISAAELKNLMVALGAAEVTDEAAVAALAAIEQTATGWCRCPSWPITSVRTRLAETFSRGWWLRPVAYEVVGAGRVRGGLGLPRARWLGSVTRRWLGSAACEVAGICRAEVVGAGRV